MTKTIRVFFDSSVLFAAAYSGTGHARDLLILAAQDRLQMIVSQDVIDEVERNIARKAPARIETYSAILEQIDIEMVADPAKEAVLGG